MKRSALISLVLATVFGTGSALAQQKMDDMKGMDMGKQKMEGMKGMGGMDAPGAQTMHKGVGVVKKLDAKAGSVTIAHEPVKSLNWPAMTMTFNVKDKALLDKLALGKKVEFDFVQDGKRYVVTDAK